MNAPTFGSLFSGIGGIDLGLERAGFECKWQVEIDDYASRVLAKHWPSIKRYRDIGTVHGPLAHADPNGRESSNRGRTLSNEIGVGPSSIRDAFEQPRSICDDCLPEVELICGGFPCQPVSTAGKRKAQEDARWLWPEFARIVCDLRPRYVLVENVPGLLSVNHGTAMGEVLGDLAALGYDAEWESIPAAALGAPHLRYRVFIVAYTDTGRHASGLRQESESRTYPEDPGAEPRGSSLEPRDVANDDAKRRFASSERLPTPRIFRSEDRPRPKETWPSESGIRRMVDGVPDIVDRLKCLGNAVVPPVAEWVGRRIQEAMKEER